MPDRLGEICTLQGGFAFKSKDFCSDGVPVVKIADVTGGTSMEYHSMQCIPYKIAETAERFRTQESDTLISMTGANVGKVTRVWPGEPMALINQRVGRFVPKEPEKYSKDFIHYLVSSHEAYEFFRNAAYGSAQPNISGKLIESLPLPDLGSNSPTEIGALLRALDDKIELNRKTAATLEAMARALYRSWFVDFDPVAARSEGRAHAHMPPTTAALFPDRFGDDGLPEGWEIAPLSEMCDHVKKTVKPMEAPDQAFLHFSLPAYDAGKMPIAEPGDAIKSNKTFVPHDAILFSRLNPTIPRVWWARTKGSEATPASSTEFFIAKAHDPSETSWLYCALSSDEFREAACARVTGTSNSHQRIPPKALAEIEVIAPSPDVVSAFGELAGPWFEKIHAMASENQNLAALRDTLLPRLMSGELRIGAAREQAEAAL